VHLRIFWARSSLDSLPAVYVCPSGLVSSTRPEARTASNHTFLLRNPQTKPRGPTHGVDISLTFHDNSRTFHDNSRTIHDKAGHQPARLFKRTV